MKAAVFKCWGLRAWPACSFPPRLHMHPGLSVKTVRLQPQLCLSGETLVSQQRDVNVSAVRHPSLIAETRLSRPWDARLSSLRHLHSPHFLHLISWICGRLVGSPCWISGHMQESCAGFVDTCSCRPRRTRAGSVLANISYREMSWIYHENSHICHENSRKHHENITPNITWHCVDIQSLYWY